MAKRRVFRELGIRCQPSPVKLLESFDPTQVA
eukprot:CAMPEP_0204236830 /NCGR_PEP_ID=MMETSP0361-20130328/92766_1 /ASSEMBLY_ACC=CAM_ASM_000343 /TAXON_ID=268821 /ORGANISM="Scrippsiella Hangoei, Strain SHTV-5" /LENGTH=31 /DNA_ID= /DNA_START= /DNA_END= /DNA_ORIENTATION=